MQEAQAGLGGRMQPQQCTVQLYGTKRTGTEPLRGTSEKIAPQTTLTGGSNESQQRILDGGT